MYYLMAQLQIRRTRKKIHKMSKKRVSSSSSQRFLKTILVANVCAVLQRGILSVDKFIKVQVIVIPVTD